MLQDNVRIINLDLLFLKTLGTSFLFYDFSEDVCAASVGQGKIWYTFLYLSFGIRMF